MTTFTAGFLFCGLGAGARGFLDARAQVSGTEAAFRSLGGIDVDEQSCADFETITGSPAVRADLATMQPDELRAAWGEEPPDAVFLSPPCKGFSGLLPAKSAARPEYQRLNLLVLQGLSLVCSTWSRPPGLLILENVPRITSRGATLLAQVRDLLRGAGYELHESTHDCGEIGGLAQHRRRYLLVARLPSVVSQYLYRPPRRRVLAIGEVLGPLPFPEHEASGPLHRLPRISWLNWARLALIPAGGDWRDLGGVLADGQARREVWSRHDVRGWESPARTVAGSGSNAASSVADPRLASSRANRFSDQYRVRAWRDPMGAVVGCTDVQEGAPLVADPRLGQAGAGAASFKGRPGLLGVQAWREPAPAVVGLATISGGNATAAVADPRLGCAPRSGAYGVARWDEPATTVTGSAQVDNGVAAIADPRPVPPSYQRLTVDEALARANGRAAPPPGVVPVIASPHDGTWHRPMTTLELAVLQGLTPDVRLAGSSQAAWRERIGNAVPVGAARAIAEEMLRALIASAAGIWMLGSTGIWVRRERRVEATDA